MKEIKLSQGLTVKVDDSDFEWLNQWKWFAHKAGINWYAMRNVIYEGKHTLIYMHRLIMNTQPLLQVDHIDHDGLNNQKTNLRICTLSENRRNRRLQGKCKYVGVCYQDNKYFKAQIRLNGKHIHLGLFDSEIEAAMAYDKAAHDNGITFANFNFK